MITINPERVCFIAIKARQFDVKVLPPDTESGSNDVDDQFRPLETKAPLERALGDPEAVAAAAKAVAAQTGGR